MSSEIRELTPEYLIEKGKVFLDTVLEQMTPEERLSGMSYQDRLQGIPSKDRLEGVPSQERLAGIPSKERVNGLTVKDLNELSLEEKEKLMAELKAAMKNQ